MEEKAAELVELLRGACERLEVAGSLRRGAAEVGDVELVCVPRIGPSLYAGDLFGGGGAGKVDYLEERLRELKGRGVLRDRPDSRGRPSWGERSVRALYGDRPSVAVDVFMVRPPAQWGAIMFIRTGPSEYVKWAMERLQGRGYRCADGRVVNQAGLVQATPTEAEVYGLLGWEYREPGLRGVSSKGGAMAGGLELPRQEAAEGKREEASGKRAEAAPGSLALAATAPGGCPGHSWRGGLVLDDDEVLRPTCEFCGVIRPRSSLV